MVHLIQLKYSKTTAQELIDSWLTVNSSLKDTFQTLTTNWPHLSASIICLADYLSPNMIFSDSPALYHCLTNATIEVSGRDSSDPKTVKIFREVLSLTASSLLVNVKIRDADNEEWHAIDGKYFSFWLTHFEREQQLKDGDIFIERYDSVESTLSRLQRLIQLRIALPACYSADIK